MKKKQNKKQTNAGEERERERERENKNDTKRTQNVLAKYQSLIAKRKFRNGILQSIPIHCQFKFIIKCLDKC